MQTSSFGYNFPASTSATPPDSLPLLDQSVKIAYTVCGSFLGGVLAATASLDIHGYFNRHAEDYALENLSGYERIKYIGLINGEIKITRLYVYPLILFAANGGLTDCCILAKSIYDRVCSRLASHS
ncbi:hypothetical protein [Endozoicomonas sp. ONNA2]|uniref:hypothetical protein n=1 Tax=Endozoicomonas sp. ONNA2 TaxID=2828741 RepID=UPI002149273E|nr:hypothetical protein [Endozoicomonas sp. ONNA2]